MKNLYKNVLNIFNCDKLLKSPPHQLAENQQLKNLFLRPLFALKFNIPLNKKNRSFAIRFLLIASFFSTNLVNAQTYTLHWGSTAWVAPTYNKTITNIGGSAKCHCCYNQ